MDVYIFIKYKNEKYVDQQIENSDNKKKKINFCNFNNSTGICYIYVHTHPGDKKKNINLLYCTYTIII